VLFRSDGVVVSDGRGGNIRGPKRVKGTSLMPTLNLTNFGDGDTVSSKKSPIPSKNVFSYNETQSGYTLNAQSWRS
jgi:hypothetical protein